MKQKSQKHILWFNEISKGDVALVGGKNASLGEMFSKLVREGINVPDGFALTSQAYWYFIKANGLQKKLENVFKGFNPQNIASLQKTGRIVRQLILRSEIPSDLKAEAVKFYRALATKYGQEIVEVAVRTSGVAEDSPTTSFAGQFETFLNVRGEEKLLWAIKESLISTFTDRAIAYRQKNKIPQLKFALSVGVQKMVRSDLASSGIIFTLDTESGFTNVVLINSTYGVGEMIVKGKITPDEFYVFKPTLKEPYRPIIIKNMGRKTKKYIYGQNGGLKEVSVSLPEQARFSLNEEEILTLAKWACRIEKHYGLAMDIEWAKDGQTNQLFVVQARPETIHSRKEKQLFFEEYQLLRPEKHPYLLRGISVGEKIGSGRVKIISGTKEFSQFQKGQILVARMTDPDWMPLMRVAAGIITDEGGKTCHAAIISRELGIPAIVGTGVATQVLKSGQTVTVDCASGQAGVWAGQIPFKVKRYDLKKVPQTKTKIMINVGTPEIAFKSSFLPVRGVGLARLEFIITEKIKIHPLALYHYKELKVPNSKFQIPNKSQIQNPKLKTIIKQIDELTIGYKDKKQYFVDELAEGISQIAAAFWPRPVIVRLSDFKSNEYSQLLGGELFEPKEENPMIGLRGASRYYDEKFRPAFQLECQAIKKVRDVFGLKNIWLMVPFCRTLEEGKKVLAIMAQNGLEKGPDLKIVVMAEIPANVILADQFLDIFDGFSIGSNDLAQLVLGLDRDSARVAKIGDERNAAVKQMISTTIRAGQKRNKYVGICGEAPSNFPDFVEFLIKEGIESISVNPESSIKTILAVAQIEDKLKLDHV
ncbi:MAG: phosphoenolpyruvate synthase [Candidatus Nealsonbacteria bacterium]|nr:phosphoenolpyruvate synthase [Candidatus Nealsonbacteria bacterium]